MSEKRQKWFWWIAEYGWVKYHHIPKERKEDIAKEIFDDVKDTDKLPTEIKMGEQLSLFE